MSANLDANVVNKMHDPNRKNDDVNDRNELVKLKRFSNINNYNNSYKNGNDRVFLDNFYMPGKAYGISSYQYSPSPPPPEFLYLILSFIGFLSPSLKVLTYRWSFLGYFKVMRVSWVP